MPSEKGIRHIFAQVVLGTIILALVALAGRLVYINFGMGKDLRAKADRQQQAFRPLTAIRGTIYDRRGRILAGTKIVSSLFADPANIENKTHIAEIVAAELQADAEVILNKIESSRNPRFVWLARDIDPQVSETLAQLGFNKTLYGLGIRMEPKRVYTAGTLAGHVLGAVSIDGVGQEGVESFYDKILRGQEGCEEYMQDAARRKIWLIKDKCRSPVNGNHIILSIDSVVQQFTQKILGATCEQYHAESGVAVVMDPKTGDILAMASWPEVDPNNFGATPPDKRRNRAVTDPYEPGSIFKPFIASRAIMEKIVTADTTFNCHNGEYRVGKRTIHDVHGYGNLTVREIVVKSSNIGMAQIGQKMGNHLLYKAIRAFGFGQRTGIDLFGEDYGLVIPYHRWTDYSTTSVPMGQEIAATSLQLVSAFAAIANDGVLLRPRLFRASIDERGTVTKERTAPEPRGKVPVLDPATARLMVRDLLRRVVTEGTGKKAEVPGYQVFGKTGTAQIFRATSKGKGRIEENAYVASFLGGAPASDPQVVAVVSIRKPERRIGYYGGTVSAPAVKEILQAYFEYHHIPPVEADNTTKSAGGDSSEF